MAKVVFDVPTLWADHHVLKVRAALVGLGGVDEVYASSAWNQVLVQFDSKKVTAKDLEKALADAGYLVGEGSQPALTQATFNRKDPAWVKAVRMTETKRVDLEMSGEFRRY